MITAFRGTSKPPVSDPADGPIVVSDGFGVLKPCCSGSRSSNFGNFWLLQK